MKALVDTNILIDYVQALEDAGKELSRYDQISISRITWIEFLVCPHHPEERPVRQEMLKRYAVLELDQAVADMAVDIRRSSRMELPDAIILATARVHGLLLVTRNRRDFPRREPDIRIPY